MIISGTGEYVNLFGKMVLRDILKHLEMIIQVGPKSGNKNLYRRETRREEKQRREGQEKTEAEWSDEVSKQGSPTTRRSGRVK